MFRLVSSGPERSDCTAPYDVVLDRAYTVDKFKKILDSLSDHGFGSMPILLGTSAPLLEDSICIDYLENKLLIRNLYYDKQLVDAAEKLKDSINKDIKQYLAECYHAGMNIKEEENE